MSAAYDFVLGLDRLGVPIFTARPGGSTEFRRPAGWQNVGVDGNAERIAAFNPGDAICAVMGRTVVVLDVDPRNGGNAEAVRQLLAGLNVTVFAEVATPGAGRHFYVTGHPDLPTVHASGDRPGLVGYPGVDVQSFGANTFLPGTQRPKYDGLGYDVVHDNLAALGDGGDPDGAEAFADWVAQHRVSQSEPFEASARWDGTLPDTRQRAYLATVLRNQVEEISAMPPESGRNTAVYTAGMKCGNFVAGAGMDEVEVIDALTQASTVNGLVAADGPASVAASIRSGLRNGKARPRTVPDKPHDQRKPDTEDEPAGGRRLVLTPASSIQPRRVTWLWDGRIALGTLGLLAGPEGLGKSTVAYWLTAQITRGTLPGEHLKRPRTVLVCAAEDSWEHTIVPRLMAADADLDRVIRIDVLTSDDVHAALSLPRDLREVEQAAGVTEAALLLLDPMMSRLSETLDTHKDGDVRRGLEPLASVADRTGMAIVGVIHFNKSGSADPLQIVMGSKAFTAVARSVHSIVKDPDDETETRRLFGMPKNNLGRTDLPLLGFTITGHPIDTPEGTAWTSKVAWSGEVNGSIADAMRRGAEDADERSAVSEAGDWLVDYLRSHGGTAASADIRRDGAKAGQHSYDSLKRARRRLGLSIESTGFPRQTYWTVPGTQSEQESDRQSEQSPRGDSLSALTNSYKTHNRRSDTVGAVGARQGTVSAVGAVGAVGADGGNDAPTGAPTERSCDLCGALLFLPIPGETTCHRCRAGPVHCIECDVQLTPERADCNIRCEPCWGRLLANQPAYTGRDAS